MSLSKLVSRAVDQAFSDPRLGDLSLIKEKDGISFRRYYRKTNTAECEVSVYRDKCWTKAGGSIFVELFCLVAQYQRAMGGCEQSWLAPDYKKPICHFQYRSGRNSLSTERTISRADDARDMEPWLREFMLSTGLPWFAAFESREGIAGYLERQGYYLQLARWHDFLGERNVGLGWFKQFLLGFPREIERDLAEMEETGLISESEREALLRASIQEQSEYERQVRQWCESRDA